MEYEIEFYDPANICNRSIMAILPGTTTRELETIAKIQRDEGRTEVKIRAGYPVYCPVCGCRSGLSIVKNNHALCQVCACAMVENEMVKAISLKQRRDGIPE